MRFIHLTLVGNVAWWGVLKAGRHHLLRDDGGNQIAEELNELPLLLGIDGLFGGVFSLDVDALWALSLGNIPYHWNEHE